ncbi:hypothetical protein P4133_02260 [Pseudomonas aeruginosa]|nr:hypothetical protein [Pseudomonas aeruginosa]
MKRLPLKLLISTLFISTTFPAFAEVGGSSNGIGQQAQATPATRTILVKMDDINYSQKTIDVKPGETVRFVLKNEGALMHEFNIGQAASQLEHQRKMASLFKDGTLTPTGMAERIVWHERYGMGDSTLQAIRKSSKPSMTTRTRFSSSPAQPKSSCGPSLRRAV